MSDKADEWEHFILFSILGRSNYATVSKTVAVSWKNALQETKGFYFPSKFALLFFLVNRFESFPVIKWHYFSELLLFIKFLIYF